MAGLLIASPAAAADPLTITVIVVNADVDGVAVTFTAAGLKRGDEVDVVTLTYTGVDTAYGPSSEPPSKVGKYRVQPSAAIFAKGSASNYDIAYVGATFSILIEQQTPLPSVEVVPNAPAKKATPRATASTPKPVTTPAASQTPAAVEPTSADPTTDPLPDPVTTAEPTPSAAAEPRTTTTTIASAITPPYSLAANAEQAVNGQVALFALLAAAGAASHREIRRRRTENDGDDEERAELSGVKAGALSGSRDAQGWGDRSRTWKVPFTSAVDEAFKALALRIGGLSPLLSRSALDASYLRAMFGAGATIVYPVGIALALAGINSSGESAVVPAVSVMLALTLLGVFDSTVGLLASAVYIVALVAKGHLDSLHSWLAALGVALLWFAPPLLASAFRPLRRNVDSASAAWERGTDYLITMLLTNWAVKSMVTTLPALANRELSVTDAADRIGLMVAVAVGVRMILEDVAYYAYPQRLGAQAVATSAPTRSTRAVAVALRTALFALVAFPFTGAAATLWLATAMFAIPQLLSFVDGKLPRIAVLSTVLPRATGRTVIMAVIGTLFAAWIREFFTDPATWAAWSFVVLGVPGLLLSVLDAMSPKPKPRSWTRTPIGVVVYRIGGVVMFVLLWQVQRGVDLLAWLFG